MKVLIFFALCLVAAVVAAPNEGIIVPEPCASGEVFYNDCALETLCSSQPSSAHYMHIPKCGCRCKEGFNRDKYTGLCRVVNEHNMC